MVVDKMQPLLTDVYNQYTSITRTFTVLPSTPKPHALNHKRKIGEMDAKNNGQMAMTRYHAPHNTIVKKNKTRSNVDNQNPHANADGAKARGYAICKISKTTKVSNSHAHCTTSLHSTIHYHTNPCQ